MIQGEVSRGDILFGAAVLAVVLPLMYVLGRGLAARQNQRFRRAWTPLVPIVNGTLRFDRTAGVSSTLAGTYRGVAVSASSAPDISVHEFSDTNGHRWEVAVHGLPGDHDWSIWPPDQVPLVGSRAYCVKSGDPALVARLTAAGVVPLAAALGAAVVRFDAAASTLELDATFGTAMHWMPTPDRFRAELDVLVALAAINATVNAESRTAALTDVNFRA